MKSRLAGQWIAPRSADSPEENQKETRENPEDDAGSASTAAELAMPAVNMAQADFRLGAWRVRPGLGSIENDSEVVHITPRSMAVLVHLAEARGEVVSRNQILDAVWPGMSVTPDALWQVAMVDEDWQAERWGEDSLATQAREGKRRDYDAAARFLWLLGDGRAGCGHDRE